jgi:hypothetical protein
MKYLLFFLCIFFACSAVGQNFGFEEATVYFRKGDSVHCWIERKLVYENILQSRSAPDALSQPLKLDSIRFVQCKNRKMECIMADKQYRLAVHEYDGLLTLLTYDVDTHESWTEYQGFKAKGSSTRRYYAVYKNEHLVSLSPKRFKEDLATLVNSCQSANALLSEKNCRYENIPNIVFLYNNCF